MPWQQKGAQHLATTEATTTEATRDQLVLERWKELMREDFRTKETVATMEPLLGTLAPMLGLDISGKMDPREVLAVIEAVCDNYALASDGVDDEAAAREQSI